MAVTFTSHGYDTTTGNPYTEVAWADAHPYIGSSQYGVKSGGDWKVTAVTGADRTVSIAPGFGWGWGVTDKTVTNETIQLDPVTSGSRWDLIAVRRDWTPTAGESKFVKVNGGSSLAIPGGRLQTPGGIDDQPLALVQVTAGQTQPTSIIDIRCWATNGGMVAADEIAKGYLNRLGTAVWIDDLLFRYQPGLNDVPEWVSTGVKEFTPLAVSGYAITGKVYLENAGEIRTRVTVDINVQRTGGNQLIGTDFSGFGSVIPVIARGASTQKYVAVAVSGGSGGTNEHATVSLDPSTGSMQIRTATTNFTMYPGALFSLNLSYFI